MQTVTPGSYGLVRIAVVAAACLLAAVLVVAPQSRPAKAVVASRTFAPMASPSGLDRLERLRTSRQMTFACFFDGNAVRDGDRLYLFRRASVPAGENCVYETRLCRKGILSDGYFTHRTCFVRRDPA